MAIPSREKCWRGSRQRASRRAKKTIHCRRRSRGHRSSTRSRRQSARRTPQQHADAWRALAARRRRATRCLQRQRSCPRCAATRASRRASSSNCRAALRWRRRSTPSARRAPRRRRRRASTLTTRKGGASSAAAGPWIRQRWLSGAPATWRRLPPPLSSLRRRRHCCIAAAVAAHHAAVGVLRERPTCRPQEVRAPCTRAADGGTATAQAIPPASSQRQPRIARNGG